MTIDLPPGLLGGPDGAPPLPGSATTPGPGHPTASVTSADEGSDLDHIRTAIQSLQLYAEGNHDDQELAKVHKAIVLCQSLLADHAKNREAALGMTPAMRHIRRTAQGY